MLINNAFNLAVRNIHCEKSVNIAATKSANISVTFKIWFQEESAKGQEGRKTIETYFLRIVTELSKHIKLVLYK